MANTRHVLQQIQGRLNESIGGRGETPAPRLSPTPHDKDVGRRVLRDFGMLLIDQVMADPGQPRIDFDADEISRLAASLRDKGQLHPVRVRWSDDHGKWIIISGERRYRAAKLAGLTSIECHFQDGELSPLEVLEQQLIENLLRDDLKPIEEARAFERLMEMGGYTGKELARMLRVNPSKVTRALALLKLPDDIQRQVESGEVSPRAAYELSKLSCDRQRREAIRQGVASGGEVTVNAVQRQVRQRRGKSVAAVRGVKQTFLTDDGYRITVTRPRKGSYHEIEEALRQAMDEVRLRIENNVQLG